MPISDPFDFPPFVPCSQRGTSAGALTFPGLSGLSQVLLQPHAMHSPQLTDVPLGAVSIKLVVSQNRTLPCPPPAPHQNITQVAAPSCTCTPVSTNTHSRVAWSPLPQCAQYWSLSDQHAGPSSQWPGPALIAHHTGL